MFQTQVDLVRQRITVILEAGLLLCKVLLFFFQTVHFGRDVVHFCDACKMTVPAARLCHGQIPTVLYELQGDSFKSSACLPTLGVYVAKHDPYLKKEHYFSQTFASCIHFGVSIILLF